MAHVKLAQVKRSAIDNTRPLTVGILSCRKEPNPKDLLFKNKTLYYTEKSMVEWFENHGIAVLVIPITRDEKLIDAKLSLLDGLLLQGGHDVDPVHYMQTDIHPSVKSDAIRDQFEIHCFKRCMDRRIPVLGICRGMQVANVALGGSLWQDIEAFIPEAGVHADQATFDFLYHQVSLTVGGRLDKIYGSHGHSQMGKVNSIHHQVVKDLAPSLMVEAISDPDGLVEAVSMKGNDEFPLFFGVQWHPEFINSIDEGVLPSHPIMEYFADVMRYFRG